jgi:translation initiation factor 2D
MLTLIIVYSLWYNPRIVPLLHTHQPVISKLQSGADLMVPGLANGPPFPSKAKKGAIVAIASLDSPSVPIVVGMCNMDVNTLGRVQGEKGIAVETLSWIGDEIWSWNPAGKAGIDAPGHIDAWLKDEEEIEETAQALGGVSLEDAKGDAQKSQKSAKGALHDDGEDLEDENQKQWTTSGMNIYHLRWHV